MKASRMVGLVCRPWARAYVLRRGGDVLPVTKRDWERWLKLAFYYGWDPAGTLPPDDSDENGKVLGPMAGWGGDYFSRDGQTVTDRGGGHPKLPRIHRLLPERGIPAG